MERDSDMKNTTAKQYKGFWGRLRFWQDVRARRTPAWINSDCSHISAESYNIFTDQVYYRRGRFGECCIGKCLSMSRHEFLSQELRGYYDQKRYKSVGGKLQLR
jgi:hypothetical protein